MSKEVLDAQVWLNSTYGKDSRYIRVKETGYPGTATSKALISALQIELGLSSVTGNFGNMTSKACDVNPLDTGSTGNKVKLLQYGLYCKGYNPRNTDGVFNQHTQNALKSIQQDAGLS
ncbi:peptidoglycan-binding domain-containing protein [Paenibacillus larvae]